MRVRIAIFDLESLDYRRNQTPGLEQRIEALRPILFRLDADIFCLQQLRLARLIFSAINSWQKTGPLMNQKDRCPESESSRTSDLMMSAGIRLGVNCTLIFEPEHGAEGLHEACLGKTGYAATRRASPTRASTSSARGTLVSLAVSTGLDILTPFPTTTSTHPQHGEAQNNTHPG